MPGTTQRGDLDAKLFLPGLRREFETGTKRFAPVWPSLYHQAGSTKAKEEDLSTTGIGIYGTKDEGGRFPEQEIADGFSTTYTHLRYGTAMRFTEEALDDEQYGVLNNAINSMGRMSEITKEILAVYQFNHAFSGGSTYYWNSVDATYLCSATHKAADGTADLSNVVSPAADLSIESWQAAITQMRKTVNRRRIKTQMMPNALLIPVESWWIASELYRSPDRPDTADRAVNVLAGMLPGGIISWNYLTDDDCWFLLGDEHERWWFNRKALRTGTEVIPQTGGDQWFFADFRSSCGASDYNGMIGSPGAT